MMSRRAIVALAAAALPLALAATQPVNAQPAQSGPWHGRPGHRRLAALELKPIEVTLPATGRLYPGPGAEAINNNCLGCHSTDMVLNQPGMPKAAWQGEVEKMMKAFKAPVQAADVPAIVAYLARVKGPK